VPAPSITPVFHVKIDPAGRVQWPGYERKRFDVLARKYADKDAEIVLRLPRKKTTDRQRRYYFGVIVALICEAAGYGPEHKEAIHEYLKQMFLKDSGGPLPITRSTESLTTTEREEYHEHCRRWAAETFGLYIPLPNEVDPEHITV
jgi:hypothetical protein